MPARRQKLEFGRSDRKVVARLFAREPQHVPGERRRLKCCKVPGGEIAAAHIEDLSVGNETGERFENLLDRRQPVHVMHLQQIAAVGAEPPKARVHRGPDVIGGKTPVIRAEAHRLIAFCGEHDLIARAAAFEPAADDFLGKPASHREIRALRRPINICRVNEIEAGRNRAVQNPPAFSLVGDVAEVHCADGKRTHPQTGPAELSTRRLRGRPRAKLRRKPPTIRKNRFTNERSCVP